MTKARTKVLTLLEGADKPLSASQIADLLPGQCDPATVYRTLHYLEDHELATSFVLHCKVHGTERYYSASESGHHHWFHCERCHRFIDLGGCHLDALLSTYEQESGVEVHDHTFFLTGLCPDCKHLTQSDD